MAKYDEESDEESEDESNEESDEECQNISTQSQIGKCNRLMWIIILPMMLCSAVYLYMLQMMEIVECVMTEENMKDRLIIVLITWIVMGVYNLVWHVWQKTRLMHIYTPLEWVVIAFSTVLHLTVIERAVRFIFYACRVYYYETEETLSRNRNLSRQLTWERLIFITSNIIFITLTVMLRPFPIQFHGITSLVLLITTKTLLLCSFIGAYKVYQLGRNFTLTPLSLSLLILGNMSIPLSSVLTQLCYQIALGRSLLPAVLTFFGYILFLYLIKTIVISCSCCQEENRFINKIPDYALLFVNQAIAYYTNIDFRKGRCLSTCLYVFKFAILIVKNNGALLYWWFTWYRKNLDTGKAHPDSFGASNSTAEVFFYFVSNHGGAERVFLVVNCLMGLGIAALILFHRYAKFSSAPDPQDE